jgi:hypothetical protein
MFVTCSKVIENSEAEKAEILAGVAYLLKVEAMIGDRFQTRSFESTVFSFLPKNLIQFHFIRRIENTAGI